MKSRGKVIALSLELLSSKESHPMALQQRKIRLEAESFNHYFLCRYIPRGAGSDRMSRSLISFKEGHPPHRKAWIDCAVSELKKIKELKEVFIIRALGHTENQIRDHVQHSLDHLGVKLAHAFSGSYRADSLSKIKAIPRLIHLSKVERDAALYNAYRFSIPERLLKRVLIIDDIYTTGATVRSIIAAVSKAAPSCDITVFTLATTDYDATLNNKVNLKSTYEWQPNDGWMRVAEDSAGYNEALEHLKTYILNNSFG